MEFRVTHKQYNLYCVPELLLICSRPMINPNHRILRYLRIWIQNNNIDQPFRNAEICDAIHKYRLKLTSLHEQFGVLTGHLNFYGQNKKIESVWSNLFIVFFACLKKRTKRKGTFFMVLSFSLRLNNTILFLAESVICMTDFIPHVFLDNG